MNVHNSKLELLVSYAGSGKAATFYYDRFFQVDPIVCTEINSFPDPLLLRRLDPSEWFPLEQASFMTMMKLFSMIDRVFRCAMPVIRNGILIPSLTRRRLKLETTESGAMT